MTAKSHRRRGATPVVVIKRYSPTAPYWSRVPRSAPTRRSKFRKKARRDSARDRSKVLLVPAVPDVNDTVQLTNDSDTSWNTIETGLRQTRTFRTVENDSSTVLDVTVVAGNATSMVTAGNGTTELYRTEDPYSNRTEDSSEDAEGEIISSNVTSVTKELPGGSAKNGTDTSSDLQDSFTGNSSALTKNDSAVTGKQGTQGAEEYYYD